MQIMTKVHAVNYLLEGSSQEPFPLLLTLWLVNFCCGCDKSTYVIDLSDFVTNVALLANNCTGNFFILIFIFILCMVANMQWHLQSGKLVGTKVVTSNVITTLFQIPSPYFNVEYKWSLWRPSLLIIS